MSKFSLIAMGGTFDIIHHGHITLLSTAFDISEKVIIGLTSDEFVQKKGKNPIHKYDAATQFAHAALEQRITSMPSRAVNPPHSGVQTPGAHEGSKTSISQDK